MGTIKIASVNIHGLRNSIKRRTFFRDLRKKDFDVICIQETYILEHDAAAWEREWGGALYYTGETSHSMGQMILIKKGFAGEIQCIYKSQRIIGIHVVFNDNDMYIWNVYAPAEHKNKQRFFEQLRNQVSKPENVYSVVCGDFNCVMDNDSDIISGENHNEKDIDTFRDCMAQNELIDVWRLFHHGEKEYTWSRKNPFIARRLDYIFATESVLNRVTECEIHSVAQSDHRLVSLSYNMSQIKRGPSYWKFNDSLLHDKTFVDSMNKLLTDYANENTEIDDQLKWELCKIKIREWCMAYCKTKNKLSNRRKAELQSELDEIEKNLALNPTDKELVDQREKYKTEMELYAIREAKGAHARARVKFIEDGEKNTKYFLNLEKARANSKVMDRLTNEEGQVLKKRQDIVKEQTRFYSNRYKKRINFDEQYVEMFLQDVEVPQLTEEQKNSIEGILTEDEITKALKNNEKWLSTRRRWSNNWFYEIFLVSDKDNGYMFLERRF